MGLIILICGCIQTAVLIAVMLAAGKFNPQFVPKLEGIQFLFSQTITAASLWVHLLSINLFAARTAYLQGRSYTLLLSDTTPEHSAVSVRSLKNSKQYTRLCNILVPQDCVLSGCESNRVYACILYGMLSSGACNAMTACKR